MTHRLELGFARRFRDLLALVRPRRLEFGVELLMGRARERSARDGVPLAKALFDLYLFTRRRVARRLEVTGACTLAEAPWSRFREEPPLFLCDHSLGALARWLRAAGYEARDAEAPDTRRSLIPSPTGDRLLGEAAAQGRVLLTSVSDLLDRRLVREGTVIALWVPTGLHPPDQLALVRADLGLSLRPPRCMACGGALRASPKAEVAARIPPRTARWKDDYWVCETCGRLFWQGTHWERIARALGQAAA
jgi:uncharacterized protein with PIN domain